MNATAPLPLTDAPERIAQLIWVLCQTVSERCSLRVRALSRDQVEYIVARLLAARKRFRRVVERIRAGNPPKLRARKPRVRRVRPKRVTLAELAREFAAALPRGWQRRAREDRARERAARKAALEAARAAAAGKPVPLWRTLRMHVPAWLCVCAPAIPEYRHSAPSHANHLRQILAEPEMQALLLSHRYVGDALSAVCHALGVEQPLLHRPPRLVVEPVVAAAAPATPAPGDPARRQAAGPVAGDKARVSRPAAKQPSATADRPMPAPRAAPRSGVVIIDYWDLARD